MGLRYVKGLGEANGARIVSARPFDSLDATVPAVLDYYFGDPAAMNPPELTQVLQSAHGDDQP